MIKNKIISALGALLVSCFLPSYSQAETLVSGAITSNTIWYSTSSPYHVIGDVTLTANKNLTIEPGVTVIFDDGLKLTVRGHLSAEGTSDNHIVFTSSHPSTATKGSWVGIVNQPILGGQITFRFCEVYFASVAIKRENGAAAQDTLYDSIFSSNTYALEGENSPSTLIQRCTFTYNTNALKQNGYDVFYSLFANNTIGVNSYDAYVYFSTFTNNGTGFKSFNGSFHYNYVASNTIGVEVENGYRFDIRGSNIINNGIGVLVTVGRLQPGEAIIVDRCNLYGNSTYSLKHLGAYDVDATSSYWGTSNTATIDAAIYDVNDDGNSGTVFYQPILNSPYVFAAYPEAITNLSPSSGTTINSVKLTWTAPGDNNGVVKSYSGRFRVKYSTDPAYSWASSDYSYENQKTITSGQTETTTFTDLLGAATYYFRAWTADSDLNWSPISNGATYYVHRIKEISDLAAFTGDQFQEIRLSWTTPTDEFGTTWTYSSSKYRIAYSTNANTSFDVGTYNLEIDTATSSGANQGRVLTGLISGSTYYLRIWMRDAVNTWSPLSNGATAWAQVDLTAPTSSGTPQDDGTYSSTTTLTWTWTAASDSETGVAGYYITIGTSAGGTEVVTDLSVGNVLTYTRTDLVHTYTYYAKIKAQNGEGLFSGYSANSDGIKIDTTSPSSPTYVNDGTGADTDLTFATTQLSANWDSGSDSESGVLGYWYAIGTSSGGTDVRSWTSVGNTLSVTATGLSLTVGNTYYLSVHSENNAGLLSDILSSDGINVRASVLDHYEVTASSSVSAGASFSVTITAKNVTNDTLVDVTGNLALQAVLASNTSLAGTGSLGVQSASLTSGAVSFANQTYLKAEEIKIKVTDVNSITALSNTVIVNAGAATSIEASANPGSVISGQTSAITVELEDIYSNPVPNQIVQLAVTQGNGQLNKSSDTTNSSGEVSATFSTSGILPERNNIQITAGSLSVGVTVYVAVLVIPASGGVIVASEDPNTKITIPANAVTELINILIKLTGELASAEQGKVDRANNKNLGQIVSAVVREFNALKQDGSDYGEFSELATVEIPYTDNNNDGIEDTTGIEVKDLKIIRLNEVKDEWEAIQDSDENEVDTTNKVVRAKIKHFSIYSIGRLASVNLDNLVVFPNPVKFSSAVRNTLKFSNLSANSEISIYDLGGHLVRKLKPGTSENDGTSGLCEWLGKNEAGEPVSAGLYYFFIKDDTGRVRKGRFAVIK